MENVTEVVIKKQVSAFIPSKFGPFQLSLFTSNQDNKEHLAIIYGCVQNSENVLVRIHSECLTGDILGSLRCDCGQQLELSMSKIAMEGAGIIIYLRQEGRGIGLIEKLKTYNLQDLGKDTIDANLALGHKEDERSYEIAAHIIKDLGVKTVRLMTNNPKKIEALTQHQVKVVDRVAIKGSISPHNANYLLTKINKMSHFCGDEELNELLEKITSTTFKDKPVVTLAYAQSLDGAISNHEKERLTLSSQESLTLTHRLRAENDALLVGIGTILTDDPMLTVRHVKGKNPTIIVLDSKLQIPLSARILKNEEAPIIFTTRFASAEKKIKLTQMKANIIEVETNKDGHIDLDIALTKLFKLGIQSVMVEGGREVITSFINEQLIDKVVITIAPFFIGGISVLSKQIQKKALCNSAPINETLPFPRLKNVIQYRLGADIIVTGDIERR